MSFSSDYDAGSKNNADTVIEATFTGEGTLGVTFVDESLATISINQRSLKVIVKGYTGISDTFANMTEINRLIIVDLSGMVGGGLDGGAFDNCDQLREITLFPNCTDIEGFAFGNCSSLKKVYQIPSGLTTVDTDAFNGANTNVEAIFNIANAIETRNMANGTATISYSPSSAPDPEITVETYSVTATAELNSDNTYVASKIFSETINSKPVITSPAFNVAENQTTVGTVTATDADGNTSFTYSIVGSTNDNDKFSINSSSGALTFKTAPDYESTGSAASSNAYIVTVGVNDGTTTVTKNITVNVTNVNESPIFTSPATFTVAENQTTAGTVQATDPEGATLSYSIVGTTNDNSKFSINSSSGDLSFVTAPNFDTPGSAANSNAYTVTVTASDGTNDTTQTIIVTVTNVNESPTFTSSATFTVAENQTTVGTVQATDPDSGATVSYSIVGTTNDNSKFSINSSSGALTFITAPDFETPGSAANSNAYTVTVTASDGINIATQTITVNVTNVNNAPTIDYKEFILSDPSQVTATELETNQLKVEVTNNGDASSFTYQWQSSPDEENWTNIDGAEEATYTFTIDDFTFTIDDVKKSLRAVVGFTYNDGTTGSKTLDFITYYEPPPTWREVSDDGKKATVGENYSYRPSIKEAVASEMYYLLETPSWLGFDSSQGKNGSGIPYSNTSSQLVQLEGKTKTAGKYTVKIAVVDDGAIYRASVLTFDITVSAALTPPTIVYSTDNIGQGELTTNDLTTNRAKVGVTNNGSATSFTYQWQRSDYKLDGSLVGWNDINDATEAEYTFKDSDAKKAFRAIVDFTYSDGSSGSKTLPRIDYFPTEWTDESKQNKTATVGEEFTFSPEGVGDGDINDDWTYYLLESPDWLEFTPTYSQGVTDTDNIPIARSPGEIKGTPTVPGEYTVKIAGGEQVFYRMSVLEFKITVLPFKPANKTELQSAIDKWYELANDTAGGSTGTTSTSETTRTNSYKSNATGEVSEKTKFYINDINSDPIELPIEGILDSDTYLDAEKGITKANLVKVEIGTAVNIIGDRAFRLCEKLNTVTIGNSVTSIGDQAFRTIQSLTTVTIGKSVKTISNFAFYECTALTAVTIPDSVTSIGNFAFKECKALTTLIIPDSVTSIGGRAFQECSALTTLTITNNVENFGNHAFYQCSALKSVIIGNRVTRIGESAFQDCTSLKSLTIPNSVTSLGGRNAFFESAIETLYMSENNGLKLEEGSQSVGDKTVNVVFVSLDAANNYEGPEYYGNPNTWDVSLITDLNFLFYGKTQDNHPDISTWNVFNVTSMQGTFSNSTFNGQLNKWNVENVTDFSYCFANNVVFNQPLFRWNTQDAITLEYMFYNAWSLNQSITRTLQYNDTSKGRIEWKKTPDLTGDDWTVDKINTYFTNIYGSARNGTSIKDPTTFRGVFGMWALFLKVPLDKDDDQKVKYPLIIKDATFIELLGSLANSVQKLISDKKKTKLTQYNKLVSITNAMLQINKANDYIQGSNLDNDYKKYSKELYTQMRSDIPFYLAWNWSKATTMAHMKHNALTFINGNTGTVNTTLSEEIAKNPVKTLMENNYSEKTTTNIEGLGQTLDNNLKETLKTVSNNSTNLSRTAAVITTKKDSAPPVFKSDITISVGATNVYITAAEQDEKGNTTIAFTSSSAALDNGLTMSVSLEVDMLANMDDMTSTNQNAGVGIKGSFGTLTVGASLSTEKVTKANSAFAVESEFGALTLGQTDDQRATQATWSIASSGVNVEFMDSNTLESAKGMLESNYATGTDTGLDAGKMFQHSIGGISVGYDSASGTSVAAGIDSVINSGGETRMSVSFGGASGVVNHGRTFTDANGITGSINTDMSVFTRTMGSVALRMSYAEDSEEVGSDNARQLQAAYTMGGVTLTMEIAEESSTTTEFGKTAEFKVVSFDF